MRKALALAPVLLTLSFPLASLDAQASPETVSVELSSFKFTPGSLTLEHGRAYRLHLVNASGGGHDFSAPGFFAASAIAPADQGKVSGGRVRLSGKQTVDITLTPEKAGVYPLSCTHFMHSSFGMTGQITVQ